MLAHPSILTTLKRDKEDILLAELLKKECHQAETNEWFTPRVLNRLPEKPRSSGKWLKVLIYATVLLGTVGCWFVFCHHQDTNVITVRDIITNALMLMGCLTVAVVAIVDFARPE